MAVGKATWISRDTGRKVFDGEIPERSVELRYDREDGTLDYVSFEAHTSGRVYYVCFTGQHSGEWSYRDDRGLFRASSFVGPEGVALFGTWTETNTLYDLFVFIPH